MVTSWRLFLMQNKASHTLRLEPYRHIQKYQTQLYICGSTTPLFQGFFVWKIDHRHPVLVSYTRVYETRRCRDRLIFNLRILYIERPALYWNTALVSTAGRCNYRYEAILSIRRFPNRPKWGGIYLRDPSPSGGSYGDNAQVTCCPTQGRTESAARGTSPPGNKSRLWSIPIIAWLNTYVSKVFTTKYVQDHHQIERRRLLASIVTSRISP